jgi:hypothetical protein
MVLLLNKVIINENGYESYYSQLQIETI